jgi:hypothetical protein
MARKRDMVQTVWGIPTHFERNSNSKTRSPPAEDVGFVVNITDELILGLELLRAYDASVDIGLQKLCLAEEEVSLWSPVAGTRLSRLVVAKDLVIPAQCEVIEMARTESPLENKMIWRTKTEN